MNLCSIFLKRNSKELHTQKAKFSLSQLNPITRHFFFLCSMICVAVLAYQSCSRPAFAAQSTTIKLEEPSPVLTQKDSLWISPVPTRSIVITIFVLPSLLDSLESVSVKTTFISTSTHQNQTNSSGCISNVSFNP